MPQAHDSLGYPIPGVWPLSDYGVAQSVAYTGTAGICTNPINGTLASTVLTSNNTIPTDGKVVVIGNKTYTFKTALTPTEGQVLIGGSADAALLNLIRAINHSGTPDTDYKCAAAHTQVFADPALTGHTITIRSLSFATAANAYATTTDDATLSFTSTVMAGATGDRGSRFVRVMLTTAGFIKIGTRTALLTPIATTADIPMAANVPEIFPLGNGAYAGEFSISAIQSASGGTLYAVELF